MKSVTVLQSALASSSVEQEDASCGGTGDAMDVAKVERSNAS
jgi:hypothetical protein